MYIPSMELDLKTPHPTPPKIPIKLHGGLWQGWEPRRGMGNGRGTGKRWEFEKGQKWEKQGKKALCITWSHDQLSVNTKTVHFWKINFVSTSWKRILKLGNLRIFSRICLKSSDCNSHQKLEAFCVRKTTFAIQSRLHGFPYKSL